MQQHIIFYHEILTQIIDGYSKQKSVFNTLCPDLKIKFQDWR